MNKKITPASDMFLYYVAGDEVCMTSGQFEDADAAIDAFAKQYPDRGGATYAMGVTDDSKGSIDGQVVWNEGDD